MASFTLELNGAPRAVEADPATPLLWVLRDALDLRGTKYGCGEGLCGCCTVLIDGQAARACATSVAEASGRRVVTIEGLAASGHPLVAAWIAEEVPQCGWCQPGQIVQAAALLAANPTPSDAEIVAAMAGNLCRCGTYGRIRRAVRRAAAAGGAR